MIKKLAEHVLPNVSKVTLIVTGNSDKVTVAIICDAKKDGGLKPQPITISGTPDEVEAGIDQAIKAVFSDNKELFSNAEAVAAQLKKDAAEASKKKTITPTKGAKPPTAAQAASDSEVESETEEEEVKEEKAPKLEAAQKKAEKEAAAALGKAANATDPDMREFIRKETIKKYEAAKMPEYYMKRLADAFAKLPAIGTKAEDAATEDTGMFAGKAEEKAPVVEAKKPEPEPVKEEPVAAAETPSDEDMIF